MAVWENQFYALNLDILEKVTQQICQNSVSTLMMENGAVSCMVDGHEGENLYLSVPYDKGWRITLNGQRIVPELFENCMMSIPLMDGENKVELVYQLPQGNMGIVVSLISMAILVLYNGSSCWSSKRKFWIRGLSKK